MLARETARRRTDRSWQTRHGAAAARERREGTRQIAPRRTASGGAKEKPSNSQRRSDSSHTRSSTVRAAVTGRPLPAARLSAQLSPAHACCPALRVCCAVLCAVCFCPLQRRSSRRLTVQSSVAQQSQQRQQQQQSERRRQKQHTSSSDTSNDADKTKNKKKGSQAAQPHSPLSTSTATSSSSSSSSSSTSSSLSAPSSVSRSRASVGRDSRAAAAGGSRSRTVLGSADLSSMRRYFAQLDTLPLTAVAEIVPVPEVTER